MAKATLSLTMVTARVGMLVAMAIQSAEGATEGPSGMELLLVVGMAGLQFVLAR